MDIVEQSAKLLSEQTDWFLRTDGIRIFASQYPAVNFDTDPNAIDLLEKIKNLDIDYPEFLKFSIEDKLKQKAQAEMTTPEDPYSPTEEERHNIENMMEP